MDNVLFAVPLSRTLETSLGVSIVSAHLKKKGIESYIYDMNFKKYSEDISLKECYKELESKMNNFKVIGISCYDTEATAEIAGMAKSQGKRTVIGGSLATLIPQELMNYLPNIDVAVIGRGEEAMFELLSKKNPEDIAGIYYRINDKILKTKKRTHSGELECQDWDYISESFKTKPYLGAWAYVGTECQGACKFCSGYTLNSLSGLLHNKKNPELLLKELTRMHELGIKTVSLGMDNIASDEPYFMKVIDSLKKAPKINNLRMLIRVDDILNYKNKILELSHAHGIELDVGYENGCQRILDLLSKNQTINQIEDCEAFLQKNNIPHLSYWMNFGHPEMTMEDMDENVKTIKRLQLNLESFQYPHKLEIRPKSPLWYEYKKKGLKPNPLKGFEIEYEFNSEINSLFQKTKKIVKFLELSQLLYYQYNNLNKQISKNNENIELKTKTFTGKALRESFIILYESHKNNNHELIKKQINKVLEEINSQKTTELSELFEGLNEIKDAETLELIANGLHNEWVYPNYFIPRQSDSYREVSKSINKEKYPFIYKIGILSKMFENYKELVLKEIE
ncbi:MAG: cobalamin-dependent protein [Candidatus Nanoarchaeia archaeon]|nr:cobalamin-dependent protein [Candidatus Nanoarchaeia archaeon]